MHVEGEGNTLVLDLLPLDPGMDSWPVQQPVTVGLAMTGSSNGELDALLDTLHRWNRDPDDICDIYMLPSGNRRRIVLVHAGDVVVIETD
jgi:hypothetical protein